MCVLYRTLPTYWTVLGKGCVGITIITALCAGISNYTTRIKCQVRYFAPWAADDWLSTTHPISIIMIRAGTNRNKYQMETYTGYNDATYLCTLTNQKRSSQLFLPGHWLCPAVEFVRLDPMERSPNECGLFFSLSFSCISPVWRGVRVRKCQNELQKWLQKFLWIPPCYTG